MLEVPIMGALFYVMGAWGRSEQLSTGSSDQDGSNVDQQMHLLQHINKDIRLAIC